MSSLVVRHDASAGVSEVDAVGRVAEVFAQIRSATQTPFVTSVWRVLAHDEDTLRSVWERVAPHIDPKGARQLLRKLAELAPVAVDPVGLDPAERLAGAMVVRTYTVANATVMRALTRALDPSCPQRHPPGRGSGCAALTCGPVLPPLRERTDLADEVLTYLDRIDATGQPTGDPLLHATIWRHLGSVSPSTLEPLACFMSRLDPTVLSRMIAQMQGTVAPRVMRRTPSFPRGLPDDLYSYLWYYATDPRVTPRVVALGVLAVAVLGEEF